jgi:hypothetical protein
MNELKRRESEYIKNAFWPFFGCFCQQNPNAVLSLNRLLLAHDFDTIIELGTHSGGLSTLFALYCLGSQMPATSPDPTELTAGFINTFHHKHPKTFHTFDNILRDKNRTDLLLRMGTNFRQLDLLENINDIEYVRSIIKTGRTVLLLCDNGNKRREFELYGSSLKPGDFIMTHDYAKDKQTFELNKANNIWHSWETRWEDKDDDYSFGVKDLCERYNIKPMYAEEFDPVVWFCGQKQ